MSRNSRKTLWVAAIVFIIFGVPIFAYFLTQQPGAAERAVVEQAEAEGSPVVPSESASGARTEPTPGSVVPAASAAAPEPTPTTVNSGDPEKLRRAREAESRGFFRQSVKRYEEYLRSNPNQADAAVANGELENLKKFVTFLRDARTAAKRQNFEKARLNYVEALKIRPYSRVVRDELDQAEKRLSGSSR